MVRLFPLCHCRGVSFPQCFFPDSDPTIGLVLSFGTFAFGFIARPLGGIVFGHFGDRVGRKKTLIIALWMMGISSTLIGLLPTYATIGVAAPIFLCVLRFAQGLAIGGQWGGAMLLVTESAPADKRGYYGAYAQAGAPVGVILANIAFILISSSVSEEAFMAWGWRVPFISSILLIGISMYVQLHLEDTAAFKELQAIKEKRDAESPTKIVRRSPIIEALVKYPKRIALAAGAFLSIQVAFYILIGFVLAYGGGCKRCCNSARHNAICSPHRLRGSNTYPVLGGLVFGSSRSPRDIHARRSADWRVGIRLVPTHRYR